MASRAGRGIGLGGQLAWRCGLPVVGEGLELESAHDGQFMVGRGVGVLPV